MADKKYKSNQSSKRKISGSYILIINNSCQQRIRVGALGELQFKKGYYFYVGSALHRRLLSRVSRHTKPKDKKKSHWHIDYLLNAPGTKIHKVILIPSNTKEECQVAHEIAEFSDGGIAKFGCSDCNCESHLFYFLPKNPNLSKLF